MCERCGEVSEKQEHTWSAFEYLAAGLCEQQRRCEWCRATESRVLHSWGPWLYVAARPRFRQSSTCRRCGQTRYLPPVA